MPLDSCHAVNQAALNDPDRCLRYCVFRHPAKYCQPGLYPLKLVEGNPSSVTPPLINADWDFNRSNKLVKQPWLVGLPLRVKNFYINFDPGNWNKFIEIIVIHASKVNRYTGEIVWDTKDPLTFTLLNDDNKDEPIYPNGYRFVAHSSESYLRTLHLAVQFPPGDHALRVIFRQIDEPGPYLPLGDNKQHTDNTQHTDRSTSENPYGRIFLTTYAANCKYNTLKWKGCIFT
jgi:hypothetical protein